MAVRYEAKGKLGEILSQFKIQYLAGLQPKDLDMEVILRVEEALDTTEPREREDSVSLKERLLEVIQNECEG
jgi:hypothetical protein